MLKVILCKEQNIRELSKHVCYPDRSPKCVVMARQSASGTTRVLDALNDVTALEPTVL